MGGVDEIGLDLQVLINELAAEGVVGEDPAHFSGGDDDILGPL